MMEECVLFEWSKVNAQIYNLIFFLRYRVIESILITLYINSVSIKTFPVVIIRVAKSLKNFQGTVCSSRNLFL